MFEFFNTKHKDMKDLLIKRIVEYQTRLKMLTEMTEEAKEINDEENHINYKSKVLTYKTVINDLKEVLRNFNNDVLLENVTEREEINCHTGTEKEELIAFVETNKGRAINLHFENNISQYWGDDDIRTYYTNRKTDYNNILKKINTHYIHNIKCVG